jgi:hypothetical protein
MSLFKKLSSNPEDFLKLRIRLVILTFELRAENAIRPYCTGRKNWLFSDTKSGAQASATVYSIIETSKRNSLNPYMYLVHLLTQLPNLKELTPETLRPFLPWEDALPKWCRNSKD